MRKEIRFRAWHKRLGKMYLIYHSSILDGRLTLCGLTSKRTFKEDGIIRTDEQKNVLGSKLEIMQFTGVRDKLGKEIYEGDIVRLYFKGRGYEVHVVEFFSGIFKPLDWIDNEDFIRIEVIGNIYENPELLNNVAQKKEDMTE